MDTGRLHRSQQMQQYIHQKPLFTGFFNLWINCEYRLHTLPRSPAFGRLLPAYTSTS